jgi:hypothetical protein
MAMSAIFACIEIILVVVGYRLAFRINAMMVPWAFDMKTVYVIDIPPHQGQYWG